MSDAQKLIAEYRAAYQAANDEEAPAIGYENGWFMFLDEPRPHSRRFRREKFMAMRNTLRQRAAYAKGMGTP